MTTNDVQEKKEQAATAAAGPAVRACLSGEPLCSGASPCRVCWRALFEGAIVPALGKAGLQTEEQAQAFFGTLELGIHSVAAFAHKCAEGDPEALKVLGEADPGAAKVLAGRAKLAKNGGYGKGQEPEPPAAREERVARAAAEKAGGKKDAAAGAKVAERPSSPAAGEPTPNGKGS